MKTVSLFQFLISVILYSCHQTEKATPATLPLTLVDGYGPFNPGFSKLGNERQTNPDAQEPWRKMCLNVRGIPADWSNVDKAMIWLNTNQLVYQNFIQGTFTKSQYNECRKYWKLTADTSQLSRKPIKCYVYTLRGFDEQAGKWAVLIDTNNNLDFSDETAFYPEVIQGNNPYSYKKLTLVNYEIYRKGKILKASLPMLVKTFGSDFFYNFPQYAQATLKHGGNTYNLAVSFGFTRPDFDIIGLADLSSLYKNERLSEDKLIEINENVRLDGITYKNKGVDFYNNVLRLDPVIDDKKEYSLQVGYPFRPFAEQEFTSRRPIALADFKGKYVYVDFWGTWCKGCVDDIPNLKKLYAGLDKNRFEFIGIVQDSPERLTKFIKKQDVQWPQILSDEANKLVESYPFTGYPTSVLLDKNGLVLARDLRGNELRDKLKELSAE
ncbi:peroxiredoxin family protein [Spirosoma linguale]|uniref:Alkyl hydroperoxide reductase/ Thiol specific antioxidant/ Mal allergen n=1 Tax=Spirosoma linguale (strain ATCC 33905 / DSM 74 / LMG 10896 / Claus 1) TaxID=504472 RepID=D2QNU7_SPILD|nr:alkyl hydroperoxide reductase/ Thiol specific antioxidant/ Mal allergen [Spirosoma linguale DSM 74]